MLGAALLVTNPGTGPYLGEASFVAGGVPVPGFLGEITPVGGIPSTLVTGPAGAVAFFSVAGLLTGDAADFVYIAATKRYGLGVAAPAAKADIQGNAAEEILRLRDSGGTVRWTALDGGILRPNLDRAGAGTPSAIHSAVALGIKSDNDLFLESGGGSNVRFITTSIVSNAQNTVWNFGGQTLKFIDGSVIHTLLLNSSLAGGATTRAAFDFTAAGQGNSLANERSGLRMTYSAGVTVNGGDERAATLIANDSRAAATGTLYGLFVDVSGGSNGSVTRVAARFIGGPVQQTSYTQKTAIADPGAPAAGTARFYAALRGGNSTFGIRSEVAPAADAALVSTHSVIWQFNGADYKVMLVGPV